MSSSTLTVFGGASSVAGLVSIPSSLPSDINSLLQAYLDGVSSSILGGSFGIDNDDVPASLNQSTSGSGSQFLLEITNTDSTGATVAGSASGSYTVPAFVTDLIVQAPGDETIAGNGQTSVALFGANSNVTYSVTNGGPASIFAAGGADSIVLRDDASVLLDDTIVSAGNDTLDLFGLGSVNATAGSGADDRYIIEDSNATITALGNATVEIGWANANSGGSLDFINQSNTAATVLSSVFPGGKGAATNVTVFGGAGGGYYIGGQGSGKTPNLLVGGAAGSVSVDGVGAITQVSADSAAGVVTLVGGVNGDVLDAQSGLGQNDFFAGSGSETLIAASTTGANLFQLGLNYPGIGEPQSNGVVSTEGSGMQTYFLGNSAGATIFGSTAASFNIYNVIGDSTTGGGTFTIENFAHAGFIFLENAAGNASGDASVVGIAQDPFNANIAEIGLSDGTTIKLVGVQASSLTVSTIAGGIVRID